MRDLERWLGDGGMPLITRLGAALTTYGEGWVEGTWDPTPECDNPLGTVQGGVQSVLLDAAMNFALLAALERGDSVATLEMKISNLRAAPSGERLTVRGETVRVGRRVGFAQAWLRSTEGLEVAHATGTFVVNRRPDPSASEDIRPEREVGAEGPRRPATSWPARSRGWCRWRGRSRRPPA